MAYAGLEDMVAKLASGKFWSQDFFKLSGAAAHVAGNAYDLNMFGGNPAPTTYPGTALNSVAVDDTTGFGLWHGGNVATDTKHFLNALAMAVGSNSAPGFLRVVDVAMYYPGIDLKSTALQTLAQAAALPARHAGGIGLRPYIVTTVQSGGTPASTPVLSVFNYRNQSDVDAALTGVGTINFTAGAAGIPPVGKIVHCAPAANHPGPFLPWNAGDRGVKRVNSLQLSTAYTGSTTTTGCCVLCKPLFTIALPGVGIPGERSLFAPAPLMPPIPDGACLGFIYLPGAAVAANSSFQGVLDFGWG